MMTNRHNRKFDQMIFYTIEQLVPEDHLVRKLEDAIDWSFIYGKVHHLYSTNGRPSIDPVVLVKMIVIDKVFGINSMRKTCKELEVNLAYRWFIGYDIEEKIPNYSTWSQNYIRRYGESDLFSQFFEAVLEEVINNGFLDLTTVFGDSTHMKASANKNKYTKNEVELVRKKYEDELLEEINQDREWIGKKTVDSIERAEYTFDEETGEQIEVIKTKEVKVSTTDPDAGDFHKGEHEKCFAYSHSVFCDRKGFALAVHTEPGNVHDSVSFFPVYESLLGRFGDKIENVCLDSAYRTPPITREIINSGKKPYLPYKRPMTKEGFFKKYEYVYDEEYDVYLCPNNKQLTYTTTNRKGYREYKSDAKDCRDCPFINQCTHSKNQTKVIHRHLWEKYLEQSEEIRCTDQFKEIYPQRKQTIERVFADDKERHCLRFTRVRGLKKNRHNASIIFACHNLERLGRWKA